MKYIFLDIDGTLYTHGKEVPQSARDAIKQAQNNGHKVFFCTGRTKANTKMFDFLHLDGLVGSAGSYVEVDHQIIVDKTIQPDELEKLRKSLDENHIFYQLECTHITYQSPDIMRYFLKATGPMNSELGRLLEEHKKRFGAKELEYYQGEPVHKICFMCHNQEDIDKVYEQFKNQYHFIYYGFDELINGDIYEISIDKAKGIKALMDYYHADMKDTIAFGDSMNDLEMIQACHVGVVMGDGSDELKQYADMITDNVNEDGLYHAFKKLNLI